MALMMMMMNTGKFTTGSCYVWKRSTDRKTKMVEKLHHSNLLLFLSSGTRYSGNSLLLVVKLRGRGMCSSSCVS